MELLQAAATAAADVGSRRRAELLVVLTLIRNIVWTLANSCFATWQFNTGTVNAAPMCGSLLNDCSSLLYRAPYTS